MILGGILGRDLSVLECGPNHCAMEPDALRMPPMCGHTQRAHAHAWGRGQVSPASPQAGSEAVGRGLSVCVRARRAGLVGLEALTRELCCRCAGVRLEGFPAALGGPRSAVGLSWLLLLGKNRTFILKDLGFSPHPGISHHTAVSGPSFCPT